MPQPVTYYDRHKATITQRLRRTRLTTRGGKVIRGLVKRDHPGGCELCSGRKGKRNKPIRLEYHHWIPKRPDIGIWLCYPCHRFVELLEDPSFPEYQDLYTRIKHHIEERFNV
ncbi:hypothetical protein ES703_49558 [subsurface metagenome]